MFSFLLCRLSLLRPDSSIIHIFIFQLQNSLNWISLHAHKFHFTAVKIIVHRTVYYVSWKVSILFCVNILHYVLLLIVPIFLFIITNK